MMKASQNSEPQNPIPSVSLDWSSKESISARASIIGERLALKSLESIQPLATNPLIVSAGANGCAVLLRYGVVVTFNLSISASEVLTIGFRSNTTERLESEILWLQELRTTRTTGCSRAKVGTDL